MEGGPNDSNPQEGEEVTGNYRAVSVASVIGKMIESIIKDGLVKHDR